MEWVLCCKAGHQMQSQLLATKHPSQGPVLIAPKTRNEPSSKICVAPGRQGCQASGKAGMGGGSLPVPAGQLWQAGFLEWAWLLGLGLLPADAHVYAGEAGGTWMPRLVLRNLDSIPWTATKTLVFQTEMGSEHVAAAQMPQVSNLILLVFPDKLAPVTLHHCHLPFRSLLCDSFLN